MATAIKGVIIDRSQLFRYKLGAFGNYILFAEAGWFVIGFKRNDKRTAGR